MSSMTKERSLLHKPVVNLSAPHINAYFIMGFAVKLGQRLGFSANKIEEIKREMSHFGGYEHIVNVFIKEFGSYVQVIK